MSIDPVELAAQLIRCPSVTPARGQVFDVLEAALKPLGFTMHRWVMGEAPDGPTENMVAIRGEGSPHFGFAGHLDVVPPGEGWSADPFGAEIRDGLLIGRGANDMKSAIAAFAAAISRVDQTGGTVSFLITGDEEGYSLYGTPRIIDWLKRAADQARHGPDRRAHVGRSPRRHRENRPPRLSQHVDRGARRSGPCRLSAPGARTQSRPSPG